MTLQSITICLAFVYAGTVLAAPPAAVDPNDPRLFPTVADPNDPHKTRATVSPQERERMGLTPKSWSGVVHPDVNPALEQMGRTVAELRERVRRERDVQAFDALWQIQYPGTVYVEVQLTGCDAQQRVLASLTAAEFHVVQAFDGIAGLVGYASRDALQKLGSNPDVRGVCIDDKPVPVGGPTRHITKDNLPPAEVGEADNEPGVREGRVDPDVYRALALTDRVNVQISLHADSLPELIAEGPEMSARNEQRNDAERALAKRVLDAITADDLWLSSRLGTAMSGGLTREGVQKLLQNPAVQRIYLPGRIRIKPLAGE